TCILGSMFSFGLMTPSDLSSFSLGLSPGAGVFVPCATDGVALYTKKNSNAVAMMRNMNVARMRDTVSIDFDPRDCGGQLINAQQRRGFQRASVIVGWAKRAKRACPRDRLFEGRWWARAFGP